MTYSLKLDSFSGLCTILDGDRVVATDVGPRDAALIVEAVMQCVKAAEDYRARCLSSSIGYATPPRLPFTMANFGTPAS